MNPRLLMSILAIVSIVLCVALIFLGLLRSVKALSREDRTKEIPKETVKKNTITIVGGIFFFVVYRFCSNYLNLPAGTTAVPTTIALTSLLQGAYTVGFTAFLPFLINKLRAHGARDKRD